MRNDVNNFAAKHEKIIGAKEAASVVYVFEIELPSGALLALNSSGRDFAVGEQIFRRFSSLNLIKGEFNDSAENYIMLHGIFEADGITKEMVLAGCKIKIYHCLDCVLSSLVTYFITQFEKHDLDFTIKCEPSSAKYNQSLLLLFSKTCRANFGDHKCGVDLKKYKKTYGIKSIKSKTITLLDIEEASGYYNHGLATFENEFKKMISFKIISHHNNEIELEESLPDNLLEQKYVSLIPSCDKNFITCCNKFDNAVNFRGEPTIAEHNFLKNDA
jgi:uncharacterized phage protein (TIGR02218 family)